MKIGFIGFGHMAGAMAKGFIKSGFLTAGDIYACASDYDKLVMRAEEHFSQGDSDTSCGQNNTDSGIHCLKSPSDVANASDVVIIAVKPNQVEDVIYPITDDLFGKVLISVAFGWDFDRYDKLIPEVGHISIIPNTPCEVCMGMTIIEDKNNLSRSTLNMVEMLLRSLGEIEYFPTNKMWLAGELTSCGPAFAAMFIEALGDAGAEYGLDKEKAYRIVSQMVAGTGTLQIETGKLPGQMTKEVATPGGITIKGVTALREAGFHEIVAKAIDAIEK